MKNGINNLLSRKPLQQGIERNSLLWLPSR
nr:MAG TPA: hypothetical protein [Caudoviricetes sp.]